MRTSWIAILGLVSLAVANADAKIAQFNYLKKDSFDAANLLAPFPGAELTRKEIDHNLELQAKRTADDCKRANSESSITPDSFFGPAYGPLSVEEVAKFKPLLEKVLNDANFFIRAAKKKFTRRRPFQTDPTVTPCLPFSKLHDDSYPSGHTTLGRLFADVLAQVDPVRRNAFIRRGDQIGEDRVIGGVHHESDVHAGQMLADRIFLALLQSPVFLAEVRALQAK